jgi:serine/threonine protein kinase
MIEGGGEITEGIKMNSQSIGRYIILSEIARGGMATVYLADDPNFNRKVAIKVLPRQFTHDPQFLSRFKKESKTIAALEHQNIVPVYDFGEQDDLPYLVMRYMAGGSLNERITKHRFSVEECIQILQPIAIALDYAHENGVIHRDIKPANVLFDNNGIPYLSDFGIVRLAEATASFTGSSIIGTPAYMSPEQVKGGVAVDGRSDLYAFGILLYEMLSGDIPYHGETPTQQLMKHVLEPVPRITTKMPDVSPAVEQVLMRALAKSPDDRFQTAVGMVAGLQQAQKGVYQSPTPIPAPPSQPAAGFPEVEPVSSTQIPSRESNTYLQKPSYQPLPVPPPKKGFPLWVVVGAIAAVFLLLIGGGTIFSVMFSGGVFASGESLTPSATNVEKILIESQAVSTPTQITFITKTPTIESIDTATPTQVPLVVQTELFTTFLCVETHAANLRAGPSTRFHVVGTYPQGESFEVIASNKDASWYNIRAEDGKLGWISSIIVMPCEGNTLDNISVAETIPPTPTSTRTPFPSSTPTEIAATRTQTNTP